MTIFIDCDGVLADYVGALLDILGKGLTPEDIVDFDFKRCPKLSQVDLHSIHVASHTKGFVQSLDVYEGAREFLTLLRNIDRVVCLTTPTATSKYGMYERAEWLREELGFEDRDIVQCHDKTLCDGEGGVLIDDSINNCVIWPGDAYLVRRPWSATCEVLPALTYTEILAEIGGSDVYQA